METIVLDVAAGDRTWVDWLDRMAASRDLTEPPPRLEHDYGAALQRFVDGLRAEMLGYREIVEGAERTAELNARQLAEVVANTVEQRALVERAAAAIAEIDRGAAHVAATASSLGAATRELAASTTRYDEGIGEVLVRLDALAGTVESAATFAASMDAGSGDVSGFLERLQRIARQARLLGINAAIEAAHLGDAGRGFVIVASEVKKLATSTADSARDVGLIERHLREVSGKVRATISQSSAIVRDLATELADARRRSQETHGQVRALDGAIADVAEIAGEQSANLSAIADGVERVIGHAQSVADAAQRAAQLALGDAIRRLHDTIGAYRLGEQPPAQGAPVPADLPPVLLAATQRLRACVDDDQRRILALITALAVSIARNSYEWRAIAGALQALQAQLDATVNAIDETALGAQTAARSAQHIRESLGTMSDGFGSAVRALHACLERVDRVRGAVEQTEGFVSSTAEAAERAAAILDLIETISSETTLLSLNAAIEAAHAGSAGSGFGIIADEIRRLAEITSGATQEIAQLIGSLATSSRSVSETTGVAVRRTAEVHAHTTGTQQGVAELRGELDGTITRANEVASIVDQQLSALLDVRGAAEIAQTYVRSDAAAATDERRLDLAMLGMRAHALAARRPLGTVAEQIRGIGLALANDMDAVFDAAVDRGDVRLDDCFDTGYVELTGEAIAQLGRLFDVSRVPRSGFDPPKFATRYDRAVEDGFNALIDGAVPRHAAIKAMFAVDLNGYCFGHYRECRKDWTGDPAVDLNTNRIKRFFEDALSLRCSRVGLGEAADALPGRAPYALFRERGCTLVREATRPWAIFTYARDTGIVYNDLSVALYAKNRRAGTIRIIYDADAV